MVLIINSHAENPYINSQEYQLSRIQSNIFLKGIPHKKFTYEKQLGMLYRIAIGALAILATVTVVPYCLCSERVSLWWDQSVKGVEQKIVMIYQRKIHKKNLKQVQFGKARARLFNDNNPANQIQMVRSILLSNTDNTLVQKRKVPPLSNADTIINGVSAHGDGVLFTKAEIIGKLPIVKSEEFAPGVFAFYTEKGKAIIQQQAKRGCTAAAAAMLIMDNGKQPDIEELRHRNLGDDGTQIKDIEKAGLVPVMNSASNLSQLRQVILQGGSAIVGVTNKLGSHVIVVDEVAEDLGSVRVRDPYHGWEITVTSEAFLKEWDHRTTMQIKQ